MNAPICTEGGRRRGRVRRFGKEIGPSIKPIVLPPRHVPHAIKSHLKLQLDEMVKKGILSLVDQPTRWVSQVLCRQKSDKLRICIDPKPKALSGNITKLDLASAFWHIQLDKESSLLVIFNTPFERYRWL